MLQKVPKEKWDSIPKIQQISSIQQFIQYLCTNFAEIITQINIKRSGDIEIRFADEKQLSDFLMKYNSVHAGPEAIHIGRKVPVGTYNQERYAISFNISGEIELNDVLERIKVYGLIKEVTWKTFPNTAIRTGQYTVYLELASSDTAEVIPDVINLAGQKVGLRHRATDICDKCNQRGHKGQ